MEIVIRKGVYGQRTAAGRVTPVARGERTSVADGEAARLVALGVAAYAEAPTASNPPPVAPVPLPGGQELPEASTDTREEKSAVQAATDGEKIDGVEVARLERMPKADLEQMAQDMGVDLSGAKNNRERAMLIVAADVSDGDAPPEPGTEDIVQ